MPQNPSDYETRARREIDAWKSPTIGWFGQAMRTINWPLDKMGDLALKTPGVGWVIEKSVGGLVDLANDAAQWSVRSETIHEEYRKFGHPIHRPIDITKLDLVDVDRTIGWLGAKYKGLALAEGAAAGVAGLPGIPVDIAALVVLNLRAIGEYASYCGFDTTTQAERLFAMNVLGLASSPTDASKTIAMAQLVKIAQDVAKKKAWKELEQHAYVQVIQRIAKALSIRLTKAKLGEIIPYVGAAVGGGFNAYFTSKVCDAAYFLYRERFLAAKYGPEWIDVVTQPAEDADPHYPEEDEPIPAGSGSPSCLCCQHGILTTGKRVCPICRHVFQGNGWDGIDAHWRAHHGALVPYEEFWAPCAPHTGRVSPQSREFTFWPSISPSRAYSGK